MPIVNKGARIREVVGRNTLEVMMFRFMKYRDVPVLAQQFFSNFVIKVSLEHLIPQKYQVSEPAFCFLGIP